MSNVVRAAEQLGHRVSEGVESGFNTVKRATVGGSATGDKTQETVHQGENRLKETGNEIVDSIKGATSNTGSGYSSKSSFPSTSNRATETETTIRKETR